MTIGSSQGWRYSAALVVSDEWLRARNVHRACTKSVLDARVLIAETIEATRDMVVIEIATRTGEVADELAAAAPCTTFHVAMYSPIGGNVCGYREHRVSAV